MKNDVLVGRIGRQTQPGLRLSHKRAQVVGPGAAPLIQPVQPLPDGPGGQIVAGLLLGVDLPAESAEVAQIATDMDAGCLHGLDLGRRSA